MELVKWANGNGQNLNLSRTELEALIEGLKEAFYKGTSNIVLETTEIDIKIEE